MIRRAAIKRTPLRRGGLNRFGNVAQKTEIHGKSFASRLERNVYVDLMMLEKAGEIRNLRTQVRHNQYGGPKQMICSCQMTLGSPAPDGVIRLRAVIPDYEFDEKTKDGWRHVVADAKGYMDANSAQAVAYKIFLAIHGEEIRLYRK